jgi:hypothetical protein
MQPKAAQEALGKEKKFRSKEGLRIWNEEIENATKQKKKLINSGYKNVLKIAKVDTKKNVVTQKQ